VRTELDLTEDLIRRHQAGVWRFLRFLGADRAAADDLTQETLLALVAARPDDRGEAALAAWLRTTARNLFVSQARRLRSGLARADAVDVEQVFVELAGDSAGEEYVAALRECLAVLAPRERELLELRYREGAGHAAIGARLRLGEEGIKSLLRRVKARLRACVARRTGDGSE
jgi:RNA polymerase sigma-70 factor (ECF subfamily)